MLLIEMEATVTTAKIWAIVEPGITRIMNAEPSLSMMTRAIWAYVINTLILIGATLVAAQIRLTLPWGNRLGANYNAQPMLLWLILLLAGATAYGLAFLAEQILFLKMVLARHHHFRVTALSITLAVIAIRLLLPDVSKLQLGYLGVISLVLGLFMVSYVNQVSDPQRIISHVKRLLQNAFLLKLWLAYNIQVRYSQTILGVLWIMLLPLATATVLSIAFSQFLKVIFHKKLILAFFQRNCEAKDLITSIVIPFTINLQ